MKYFQCHKEGHFKRDCLKKKSKNKEGSGKYRDAAIASDKEDEGYDTAGVLLASGNQTNGKWVLDSNVHIIHALTWVYLSAINILMVKSLW